MSRLDTQAAGTFLRLRGLFENGGNPRDTPIHTARHCSPIEGGADSRSQNIVDYIGHARIAGWQGFLRDFYEQADGCPKQNGASGWPGKFANRKTGAKEATERNKPADVDERVLPESAVPGKCPPQWVQQSLAEDYIPGWDVEIAGTYAVMDDITRMLVKQIKANAAIARDDVWRPSFRPAVVMHRDSRSV